MVPDRDCTNQMQAPRRGSSHPESVAVPYRNSARFPAQLLIPDCPAQVARWILFPHQPNDAVARPAQNLPIPETSAPPDICCALTARPERRVQPVTPEPRAAPSIPPDLRVAAKTYQTRRRRGY